MAICQVMLKNATQSKDRTVEEDISGKVKIFVVRLGWKKRRLMLYGEYCECECGKYL